MKFGFVVIEGYCNVDIENNKEELPCSKTETGKVAHYCLNDEAYCKYFGFCKCANVTVQTDSNGIVIASAEIGAKIEIK